MFLVPSLVMGAKRPGSAPGEPGYSVMGLSGRGSGPSRALEPSFVWQPVKLSTQNVSLVVVRIFELLSLDEPEVSGIDSLHPTNLIGKQKRQRVLP